jgi:poly(3-hydroxybutyrate) depolymerase
MTMNLDRHVNAHKDLFFHLVRGDGDSAEKHREFYDEYLAVMDLTAEFYLQTVDTVFVRHSLPKGLMRSRGRLVDLKAVRRVSLLTIEGEKDDITGVGQCAAAHHLCTSIAPAHKEHYVCPGVGHYGIFNGSKFRSHIAPRIASFVRRSDPRTRGLREILLADFDATAARANARFHEFAANAFSFAAANDSEPDRMAQRLKSRGLGAVGNENGGSGEGPQLPHFRMVTLAGNLFLDGVFRLPMLLALAAPRKSSRQPERMVADDAASSPH